MRQFLGELELTGPDGRIAEALTAIAAEDAERAAAALDEAGEHPLAARVGRRLEVLRLRDLVAAGELEVVAEVLVTSRPPRPRVEPYAHAVTFTRYRVVSVEGGRYSGRELLAAEWVMRDFVLTRAARYRPGDRHRLKLVPLADKERTDVSVRQAKMLDDTADTAEYALEPFWVVWMTVMARRRARPVARRRERVREGLVCLYTFEEGGGAAVGDRSGVEPTIDLQIESPAAVRWLREETDGRRGIEITSRTKIIETGGTEKLLQRMQQTNQISIEAWCRPGNLTQRGPARIVSFSQSISRRNFTLGQQGAEVIFHLRTTGTSVDGLPEMITKDRVLTGKPVHVVATFGDGKRRLYLNGQPYRETLLTPGDLSNWQLYRLVLGNEVGGQRAWLGKIFLVAIYDRALDGEEVRRNFEACRLGGSKPGLRAR